ncbi:MAG: acylneuraminate cytidylyltransferase family protein [Terricaulis sp.]|nr:acylneuraminate cytidylyltransferase family protein [Terricaulis sp.]
MTKITAIVPMKGHSARVPNKNIRPMCGKPLFHWILRSLHDVPEIDRIVVETDADHIAEDARASFPNVTILRRPKDLEGDEVPMNRLIEFHMSVLKSPVYLQTHSTNPLLTARTVSDAIRAYRQPGDHDSLFSVTELKTRLFKPDGSALNHNPDELIPTQDLPPVYEENSNIYIFTEASFAKRRHRIGLKPKMFAINRGEAVDIDELIDFQLAESMMQDRINRNVALAKNEIDV